MKNDLRKTAAAVVAFIYILCLIFLILSLFSMFFFNVSASDSAGNNLNIKSKIEYGEEIIVLSGIDGNKTVKYMYSPNVNPKLNAKNYSQADAKKLMAEKWYPVYGDSIDISKYIPRSGKEIKFAFRNADELPNIDGVYESRVISDYIPCRPVEINQIYLKENIKYNIKEGRIYIYGDLAREGYDYKVDIGMWLKDKKDVYINVESKYTPLGGTVTIRKSPTDSEFASIEYKLKINKAPLAPKIKVNESAKKIIGISEKTHMWSLSENAEEKDWNKFPAKTVDLKSFSEFEKQMDVTFSQSGDIIIYAKTFATDKRPASPVQKLIIKREIFN